MKGLIFVISGPSGSGKTTLLRRLIKAKGLKGRVVKSISLTTRPRRPKEKNRNDYFFIRQSEFKERLKAKKILEWTKYMGYYYGTPKESIERQLVKGKHVILCLDVKGSRTIKRLYPQNTVTIFIIPPSLKTLVERINKRGCKTKQKEVARRLDLARKELKAAENYDYCVVNQDFTQALNTLKTIVSSRINL